MTCIVGLVYKGVIYMGADSAGVAGYSIIQRADSKVFVNREFVFGFTSSFRMGQLLRHAFTPPVADVGQSLENYMSTKFIDAVRSCLKTGGYSKVENQVEHGGTFLVGHKGNLFNIDSDYQVGRSVHEFEACGCGAEIALGSMLTSCHTKATPYARVMTALKCAETFSAGVRGPFNIETLGT